MVWKKSPRAPIVGKRYGKWTVIDQFGPGPDREYRAKARCDCGNEGSPKEADLFSGRSASCGKCFARKVRHGGAHTKLYSLWGSMKGRCSNPNRAYYEIYGGKGISVCEEWLDFAGFQAWALVSGYREGLTIDRKDPEKGYNPENCRWATPQEQTDNRDVVRKDHTGVPWYKTAKANGISHATFLTRVNRGWSLERAATELPRWTR